MFKNESMLTFDKLSKFEDYYNQFNIYSIWRIQKGLLNDRGHKIIDKPYAKELKRIFNEKNLFRRSVSIAEVVSWLDSYEIIRRIISKIIEKTDINKYQNIKLFQEYLIRLSKARRVDYIFMHENKILLVEFRISDHFPNMSNAWQKKELELLIYKELMSNYISNDYDIYTYAFIMMPEYDKNEPIIKNINYNNNNIEHFCEYLITYLLE
jgi:hypothetical protein